MEDIHFGERMLFRKREWLEENYESREILIINIFGGSNMTAENMIIFCIA